MALAFSRFLPGHHRRSRARCGEVPRLPDPSWQEGWSRVNPVALWIGAIMAWVLGYYDRTSLSAPLYSAGLVLWVMGFSIVIERLWGKYKSGRKEE
jgi:hypothetical protein